MAFKTKAASKTANSPGILVLQWLTYAFWGLTALALIWLTTQSVSYFLDQERSGYYPDSTTSIAYPLAAVVVLFIISLVCDVLYSKREPQEKHGASMVIMLIHAVLFALFAIGSLIAAVFAVVNLLIGGDVDGGEGPLTILITGVSMAVVYGATLLRTLRPFSLKRVTLVYGLFMAAVSTGIVALGIMGPLLYAAETKNDRLIVRGLPIVSEAINSYARTKGELPKSLDGVKDSLVGDGKAVVDEGLVEYIPGKKVSATDAQMRNAQIEPDQKFAPPSPEDQTSFEYKLCVTYQSASNPNYPKAMPAYDQMNAPVRQTTPDTYNHPAGRVCYELQTNYGYGIYY